MPERETLELIGRAIMGAAVICAGLTWLVSRKLKIDVKVGDVDWVGVVYFVWIFVFVVGVVTAGWLAQEVGPPEEGDICEQVGDVVYDEYGNRLVCGEP